MCFLYIHSNPAFDQCALPYLHSRHTNVYIEYILICHEAKNNLPRNLVKNNKITVIEKTLSLLIFD